MSPERVLVAQIGGRRHYAVPRALHEAGRLERLVTDVALTSPAVRHAAGLLSGVGRVRSLLARDPQLPRDKVVSLSGPASVALRKRRQGGDPFAAWAEQNEAFGKAVVSAGFGGANAVYVFNGAGLEIAQAARRKGLRCIVDQTSASLRHDIALLTEEFERWPGWEAENSYSTPGAEEMARREEEEWNLADTIICGSEYVVGTLPPEHRDKCRVVPCGRGAADDAVRGERHDGAGLNVLVAGTLQLRKGVQYLPEISRLASSPGIRFRLVGSSWLAEAGVAELKRIADVRGVVPRSEMAEQYRWADVLLLPTLSEGSANVCHEALSAGVPVVTTPNAGSVVRDGEGGFLVSVRDASATAERLDLLAEDRELLARLSDGARRQCAEHSPERYANELVAALGAAEGRADT